MKKLILYIAFLSSINHGLCQSLSIDNVANANKSSFQPILEQGVVKGYFLLYFLDKYTETGNLLDLRIYDASLKQTHSVELIRDKNEQLIDGVFNGEKFCFAFYNLKSKYIDYLILNKQGETSASYVVNNLTELDIQYFIVCATSKKDNYLGHLSSIEKKGFLRYGIKTTIGQAFGIQKDIRIQLEAFSNDGEVLWTKETGLEGKKVWEGSNHLFSNQKYTVTSISFRQVLLSTHYKNYVLCLNAETGKELYTLETNKENTYYSYTGVSYDESTNEFFYYGECFDGELSYKNKSKGFFVKIISAETGIVKQTKFVSWKTDIKHLLERKDLTKKFNKRNINLHKLLRTEDGKIFAITEQSGDNDSTGTIFLYDLITFEFSKDLSLIDAHLIKKETDTYIVSKYSAGSLESMSIRDHFDYCLTSLSPNKKTFTSVYNTIKNNKCYIGSFTYKDQAFSYDKILRTGNPIMHTVLAAKVGYVAIFDFYAREKRIEIRIEKLNI